jgi:competence protein CoiA
MQHSVGEALQSDVLEIDMKFAIVEGLLCEARPKLRGQCRDCDAIMIAKCGTVKIWHWSHVGPRNCDRWWEPETEWHRDWKNEFPEQCQEVPLRAPDAELHVADVITKAGTVLELQHSPISSGERASRENFYKRMIWVVNGLRVDRDLMSFRKALHAGLLLSTDPLKLQLPIKTCSLLLRWTGSQCPVYVDFGDAKFGLLNGPLLWRLKFLSNGNAIATPVPRRSFIEHHRDNVPLKVFRLPPLRTTMTQQRTPSFRPQSRPRKPSASQTYLRRFDRLLLK